MNEYEKIMLLDRAIAEMQKALDTQYRKKHSRLAEADATDAELATVKTMIDDMVTKRNQLLFTTAKTVASINSTTPAWVK